MKKYSLIVIILLVVASIGITAIFSSQVSITGFLLSVYSTVSGSNQIQRVNAQTTGQGTILFQGQFGHLESTGKVTTGISGLSGLPVMKFVKDRDLSSDEKNQIRVDVIEHNTPFEFVVAKNISLGEGVNFNIPVGSTYRYSFYVHPDSIPSGWVYYSGCLETDGNVSVLAGQQSTCSIGFYLKPETISPPPVTSTSTITSTPSVGVSGTVVGEDASAGSLQFVKNVLDLSSQRKGIIYGVLDARTVNLYGKNLLIVARGGAYSATTPTWHMLVYDITDPLAPVLLKDNDMSGSGIIYSSPMTGLAVLDGFNYVFVRGNVGYGSFKINQDGTASLVKSYKYSEVQQIQTDLIRGLFNGLDGNIYGYGGFVQDGGLVLYNVSDPANIIQVGTYTNGLEPAIAIYGQIGLNRQSTWGVVKEGGKLYLIAHADQLVLRLHTDYDGMIYVFDVSNPASPQLSHIYKMSSSFNHLPSDMTSYEKMFLYGGEANISVDPISNRVFDFYRTVFDWQGPNQLKIKDIPKGALFRYRNGIAVLSIGIDGSLKSSSSNILLCERIAIQDNGTSGEDKCDTKSPETVGGYYSSSLYGNRNPQENYNGVFLLGDVNNVGHVGLLKSDGSFVIIPDPTGEMLKFKSVLADPSYYSDPGFRSSPINGIVTQVDSKTFAIFQIDNYSISVTKLNLSQSITSVTQKSSPPTTNAPSSLNTSSPTQTPFSFSSLLRIFQRVFNSQ